MAEDQVQKIHELLSDFDTAMLVTHGGDFAHARPMAIAHVEPNCDVWFFTGRSSPKVHEIRDDDRVLVVCQDEHSRYVTSADARSLSPNVRRRGSSGAIHTKPGFPAAWKIRNCF